MSNLIQIIPSQKYDIIGDIHGESEALFSLLDKLGYEADGYHHQGRKLIFLGDLVDRGPNSYLVAKTVQNILNKNNGYCILGNHEFNILENTPKDGSGWFFDTIPDHEYKPFYKTTVKEQEEIISFFKTLPIGLKSSDFNIVHAAWDEESVNKLLHIPTHQIINVYYEYKNEIKDFLNKNGIFDKYQEEKQKFGKLIFEKDSKLPFLEGHAEYGTLNQKLNPVKVLLSGLEEPSQKPFYTFGKWRFSQRKVWWNDIGVTKDTLIGHYWRKKNPQTNNQLEPLFDNLDFNSWHGINNNVFCLDFSVGLRFSERNQQKEIGENTHLVAMQYPEKTITFDNGMKFETKQNLANNRKIKIA